MIGKSELSQKLAQKTGLSGAKAAVAMNAMLDAILESIEQGQEVRLMGFGSFKVTQTKERRGRNPRTGEPITIPAGKRISFSPGTKLTEAARGKEPPRGRQMARGR